MSSLPHIDPTDLREAHVAVVVTVSWAGRTWRLGDRELTLTSGEHVLPGLMETPEITDEIDLGGGGGDAVSVSLSLSLPGEDVPALVAVGYDLQDATAEVSLCWHRDGVAVHAWAARHVVAEGDLVAGHDGAPDQPPGWIGASLEDSPYRREAPLVPWGAEVTATTWPTSTAATGTRIPRVFGAPGADAEVPAPILTVAAGNVSRVAVNQTHCRATQVTIVDSAGAAYLGTIEYVVDGLSQRIASVDITGAIAPFSFTSTYTSSWTAGAAETPLGTAAAPLLVAASILAAGGADIDLPEWVRVGTYLGGECAGYIDDPQARAWEVARDLIGPLPVAIHRGDGGWAPVILDPATARDRTVARVREGEDWRRTSQWQTEEGPGARVARVEATWSGGSVRVGAGTAYDGPRPHAWVRHLPRLSEGSQSLPWASTAAGAYRSAGWLARSQALGWRASAWQVPPCATLVRAGEWVELIDSAGTTHYALVTRRTLSGGIWDYTLAIPGGG